MLNTFIEPRSAAEMFANSTADALSQKGLRQLLHAQELTASFQPGLDLRNGTIVGHEGLIRGPAGGLHHSPAHFFAEAERLGLSAEAEVASRQVVIRRFAELALPGKLFLHVSPASLTHPDLRNGKTATLIRSVGLTPARVMIELTENQPFFDIEGIMDALRHFRETGFGIAIDDLGAGFSSLKLWLDLLPEIVKIDMHFVQGVYRDSMKYNFLRSVQDIAKQAKRIEGSACFVERRNLAAAAGTAPAIL